ncbi:uridylate kinase [Methylobacterium sp. J-076]|uniref:amino acid kinase family protein n=1 Tax=Methylobacterium sp. J-076 TaxID=2836655 RepID=UPI001FB8F339|nr:uridylate kinase [Methylobacterium sp. J-076]MCJ2013979.1 uridylate kinase [Methylobacterium sp. J-076]
MRVVVKVGGSLLADEARLRAVLTALADGAEGPCVVVPGGGRDADTVRTAQAEEGFSDAEAHRRALGAMGATAARFRAVAPGLSPSLAPWDETSAATALVWDPALLRDGHPAIPETWDVTSDSLALWLAARIGAPACILVKSADAPPGSDAEALSRSGLVDAAFPSFARVFCGTIAVRGPGGHVPVPRRRAA